MNEFAVLAGYINYFAEHLAKLSAFDVIQVVITITGAIAIWAVNNPNPRISRYGCIFGLIGEPFWLYTSWTTGAWGIFILACIYTGCWAMGCYHNWIASFVKSACER